MFDVISYDANGNEDKAMAKKLKKGFAKVYDNMCKEYQEELQSELEHANVE